MKFIITKIVQCVFCFVWFISCESLEGKRGSSNSMHSSKKHGHFISEYEVIKKKLPDSLDFKIKAVLFEKGYVYGKHGSEKPNSWNSDGTKKNAYQIVFIFNYGDFPYKNFQKYWTISGFNLTNNKSLSVRLDSSSIMDTLHFFMIKGDLFHSYDHVDTIGEIVVAKKTVKLKN